MKFFTHIKKGAVLNSSFFIALIENALSASRGYPPFLGGLAATFYCVC